MISGIYKIENIINNCIYIGKAKNIENRWNQHKSNAKNITNTTHLYRAMRKYGIENFIFSIIEEIPLEQYDIISSERERYWIEYYNAYSNPNNYNETEGGEGTPGWEPSQEWKDHQSKIKKEWYQTSEGIEKRKQQSKQQKEKAPFKNHTHSFEWKKQHSDRMKGENNPAYKTHTNGKMCMCIELCHIFKSTREAEMITGISHAGISAACRGKQKTAGGYHWKYIDI